MFLKKISVPLLVNLRDCLPRVNFHFYANYVSNFFCFSHQHGGNAIHLFASAFFGTKG